MQREQTASLCSSIAFAVADTVLMTEESGFIAAPSLGPWRRQTSSMSAERYVVSWKMVAFEDNT